MTESVETLLSMSCTSVFPGTSGTILVQALPPRLRSPTTIVLPAPFARARP